MGHKTKDMRHETSVSSPIKSPVLCFIWGAILLAIFYVQEARTQEIPTKVIADAEIVMLEQQLKEIEAKIIPISEELSILNEEYDKITSEVNELKQQLKKPRNRLIKIFDIFKERRLAKLLTQSQDKADRITELQKTQGPLVKDFVALADRLIDRCGLRIIALMDAILKRIVTEDNVLEQISTIWQLAERTTAAKNKYAPDSFGEEKTKLFLPPLSNNPEELRLGARISKGMAIEARAKAEKKKQRTKELQSRKLRFERMIEKWREIQRSNEEMESRGVESGTTSIPSGFNESDVRRKIREIEKEINRLSAEIREHEDNAKSLENQAKVLEQRASQLDKKEKS